MSSIIVFYSYIKWVFGALHVTCIRSWLESRQYPHVHIWLGDGQPYKLKKIEWFKGLPEVQVNEKYVILEWWHDTE